SLLYSLPDLYIFRKSQIFSVLRNSKAKSFILRNGITLMTRLAKMSHRLEQVAAPFNIFRKLPRNANNCMSCNVLRLGSFLGMNVPTRILKRNSLKNMTGLESYTVPACIGQMNRVSYRLSNRPL